MQHARLPEAIAPKADPCAAEPRHAADLLRFATAG